MSIEKRQHVRIGIRVPLALRRAGNREVLAELVNLSHRGLLVEAGTSVTKGTRIKLNFLWPPSRTCTAGGEVVRLQSDRFALSLDDTNENYQQLVRVLEMCEKKEVQAVGDGLLLCVLTIL